MAKYSEGENGSYEITKALILEGVEAYKRYELGQMDEKIQEEREKWKNSKYLSAIPFSEWFAPQTIGFSKYANNNANKVAGMILLPALSTIFCQS